MAVQPTIGEYLIDRLYEAGVRHIFGVPGDYVLQFFHQLEQSKIQVINTCDEQGAGFAADAYARIRGLGAVCVTYCVGGLKVANTTAEAYAEKSPVIVISGSPGTKERAKNPLLHHRVKEFDTQLKVFEQLTVASTVLSEPETACREIDRVIAAALTYKRPAYIEIPRDIVSLPAMLDLRLPPVTLTSDAAALAESLKEAEIMIRSAEKPVIIAGVELHRFGLQDQLLRLLQKTNIPVASTLLSKSVIGESHARYLGVYEGAMGHEEVRRYVETSDCLILLGAPMSDVDLGIFTAKLDPARSISVTTEKTSIRYHTYENIQLSDFIQGLIDLNLPRQAEGQIPHPEPLAEFHLEAKQKMTVARLFQRLNSFLEDQTVVIADPGDAMFSGADLMIHGSKEFLCPAYYTSMGFAVPASLGVQMANPELRPLVLVGDGAFQMTGMELSTIARWDLNPIIIVLNNGGYGTERPMQDGAFNDILRWNYHKIPEVLGKGQGFEIKTEGDLEQALTAARLAKAFCLLNVHLDAKDCSAALRRFTQSLSKKIHTEKT